MAEFVVGSDGTLGNLPRRKAKSVRQYAAKEDWKRQKTKEVGCKLDRIASVFQEAAQCCGGIPPQHCAASWKTLAIRSSLQPTSLVFCRFQSSFAAYCRTDLALRRGRFPRVPSDPTTNSAIL